MVAEATTETTRRARLIGNMRLAMRNRADMNPDEHYGPPAVGYFADGEGNELDFLPAPDLHLIASRIIGRYEELNHMAQYQIAYLWRRKGGTTHGANRLGACQKPSGMLAYFSEVDYVIWLAADHLAVATRIQVEASIFHELLHAIEQVDDDGNKTPTIAPHDCEMFGAEIARYGLWRGDLKQMSEAFRQLRLFEV